MRKNRPRNILGLKLVLSLNVRNYKKSKDNRMVYYTIGLSCLSKPVPLRLWKKKSAMLAATAPKYF